MTVTALRICPCPHPEPHVKPGREDFCVKCDGHLDPRWTCNADNTRAFLQLLDKANTNIAKDTLVRFEAEVLRRQKDGEPIFRQSFLSRDNVAEGEEEALDLALYAILELLVERRAGKRETTDLALSVAYHAAKAYEYLEMWRTRRLGQ